LIQGIDEAMIASVKIKKIESSNFCFLLTYIYEIKGEKKIYKGDA
jgi:hypothetical protein